MNIQKYIVDIVTSIASKERKWKERKRREGREEEKKEIYLSGVVEIKWNIKNQILKDQKKGLIKRKRTKIK